MVATAAAQRNKGNDMWAGQNWGTKIGVAFLVSLALVTAAVSVFVLTHA